MPDPPSPRDAPTVPPGTLFPQHPPIPVVPQTLSLSAVFGQHSTKGKPLGAGCKGTGSFSPYGNFISKNSKPWPCPPLPWWLLIFPLAYSVLQNATGWGGLRGVPAALTSLWESPRSMWLGAGGQCCLRRAGVLDRGTQGTFAFLHALLPAVLGAQGPWSWCAQLLGDSGVDGPCPSLPPHLGPPSPRLRLLEEQIVSAGGEGGEH